MAQPDILVTAPLPPFLYEPLKADYRCHDYYAGEPTSRHCSRRRARASAAWCKAAER